MMTVQLPGFGTTGFFGQYVDLLPQFNMAQPFTAVEDPVGQIILQTGPHGMYVSSSKLGNKKV